jgi:hypothetical protein
VVRDLDGDVIAAYARYLETAGRRGGIGKRNHALLRVLGDCGLHSAELRRADRARSAPTPGERPPPPASR